jgi:hypothetical protein
MCMRVCTAAKKKSQKDPKSSFFSRNNNNIIYNNIIIRLLKDRIVDYTTKIVDYPTISFRGGGRT